MESKEVLAKLQELGEFVRSASSTVEAPVVRKLVALYPDAKPKEEVKPVKKAAAKKTAAKKGEANPELAAELAAELGVDLAALKAAQERAIAESNIERPAAPETEAAVADGSATPKSATPAPRPGNNPFSTGGAVPRPPRPGTRFSSPRFCSTTKFTTSSRCWYWKLPTSCRWCRWINFCRSISF
jgi:translation initiation factor IF-2